MAPHNGGGGKTGLNNGASGPSLTQRAAESHEKAIARSAAKKARKRERKALKIAEAGSGNREPKPSATRTEHSVVPAPAKRSGVRKGSPVLMQLGNAGPLSFATAQLVPGAVPGTKIPDMNTALSSTCNTKTTFTLSAAQGNIVNGQILLVVNPEMQGLYMVPQQMNGVAFVVQDLIQEGAFIDNTWWLNTPQHTVRGTIISGSLAGPRYSMRPFTLDNSAASLLTSIRWGYCLSYAIPTVSVWTFVFTIILAAPLANANDLIAIVYTDVGPYQNFAVAPINSLVVTVSVSVPPGSQFFCFAFVSPIAGAQLSPLSLAIVGINPAFSNSYPVIEKNLAATDYQLLQSSSDGVRCVGNALFLEYTGSMLNNAGAITGNNVDPLSRRQITDFDHLACTPQRYMQRTSNSIYIPWRRADTFQECEYRSIGDPEIDLHSFIVVAGSIDTTSPTQSMTGTIDSAWEYLTEAQSLNPERSPACEAAFSLGNSVMDSYPMATDNPEHKQDIKVALQDGAELVPQVAGWVVEYLPLAMKLIAAAL